MVHKKQGKQHKLQQQQPQQHNTKQQQQHNNNSNNTSSIQLHKTEQSSSNNVLRTVFARESNDIIERNKQLSRQEIKHISPPHISIDYYASNTIDIPQRPVWSNSMTAEQINNNEKQYFNAWLNNIYNTYDVNELNHFEHNLEVWRQLWRVCERSDMLTIIADSRNPLFNFPSSLYNYITNILHKPLVLVLNKIDYIPDDCVDAWISYFKQYYPQLYVVPYSSKPNQTYDSDRDRFISINKKKQGGSLKLEKPYGSDLLLKAYKDICSQAYNDINSNISKLSKSVIDNFSFDTSMLEQKLTSHKASKQLQNKQHTDDSNIDSDTDTDSSDTAIPILGPSSRKARNARFNDSSDDDNVATKSSKSKKQNKKKSNRNKQSNIKEATQRDDSDDNQPSTNIHSDSEDDNVEQIEGIVQTINDDYNTNTQQQQQHNNVISLGYIGYPNSGKSSLINSICGRKLVSVSSTPGHTKHLQSIYLNEYTVLLDSPGLVFPCVNMPRAIQVLSGCYPIAQTRDPYTAVMYLAERVDLVSLYKLHPDRDLHDYEGFVWSSWTICEAYASLKGYRTKKGLLDVYRAANQILRDQLNGRVLLYYYPPNYNKQQQHKTQQQDT